MAKIRSVLVVFAFLFMVSACSESDMKTNSSATPLTQGEIEQMLSNAESFKGRVVDKLPLKVFNIIGKTENNNYQYQGWADKNSSKSVLFITNSDRKIDEGAYVLVSGTVYGMHKSTNAFGAELILPVITNTTVENADAKIFNPTIKTIEVNQEQNQAGLKITLQKIELANDSTRVYIKAENNTGHKASLYVFNSYIVQGQTQYEESNISYNETTIKSDMANGTVQDGVISFAPIKNEGNFKVVIDGTCDDWNAEISEFNFEIKMN